MRPEQTIVNVDGRDWHLFDVHWSDADGRKYSFYIYAINREHASYVVQEIKDTAQLGDEIVG
ncbi:TPA: hypothetical protein ACF1LI_004438 [Klebsiella pneumoniae]|uniref:hypothetical protein n=1 Tax=Klebsiella variicola TaxID=244366 RepID=UPI001034445A|nr:hypothetical protein [Klebsiella variicola]